MLRIASLVLIGLVIPMSAEAERSGGGGGGGKGGGRLGSVSSGIGQATGGGGNPSGGGGSNQEYWLHDGQHRPVETTILAAAVAGALVVVAPTPKEPHARLDLYAGAQRVFESDGAVTLEIGVTQRRFRFAGSITRYYERQSGDDGLLTLTMPTLTAGFRIDDGGPTRVILEAGFVGAKTRNDPMGDSSISGAIGGVKVEHRLSRRFSLIGDAHAMAFEADVRARAVRAGVRFGHVQASLRVLDFNVGPALYGPELGVSF